MLADTTEAPRPASSASSNASASAPSTPLQTEEAPALDASKDDGTRIPISFLLSLGNSQTDSIVNSLFTTPDDDDVNPNAENNPHTVMFPATTTSTTITTTTDLLPAHDPLLTDNTFLASLFPDPFATLFHDPVSDLFSDLETLHTTLQATDPTYPSSSSTSSFDSALSKSLLSPPHRDTFVASFFRNPPGPLPLIHRPTFSADTASSPLLLAVLLCGAQHTRPDDAARLGRIAEEFVFRRLEALARQVPEEGQEKELLEGLQAALLLVFGEGEREVVKGRRAVVVEVVKRLALNRARHAAWGGREWARFVRDEIRIR